MKKTRILSLVLLVLFVALAFSGCVAYKGKDKTFTCNGVEITTTNRFQLTQESSTEFSLNSLTAQISVSRIGKVNFATLEDYVNEVAENTPYTAVNDSPYVTDDGIYVIEFETLEDDTEVCLYEAFLMDGDIVWVAIFGCEASEYDDHKPYFEKWASSITFVD